MNAPNLSLHLIRTVLIPIAAVCFTSHAFGFSYGFFASFEDEADVSKFNGVYKQFEDPGNTFIFDSNGTPQYYSAFPAIPHGADGTSWWGEVDFAYELTTNPGVFVAGQGDRITWMEDTFGQVPAQPFKNQLTALISVWIDDTAGYFIGDNWYWQPTLLNPANTVVISGGGFGVQLVTDGSTTSWVAGADGNLLGYGYSDPGDRYTLTSGNWYTFETKWIIDEVNNQIDQINSIYLEGSPGAVFSVTFDGAVSNPSFAGGFGPSSIGNGTVDYTGPSPVVVQPSFISNLAFDRVAMIPEPAAALLIPLLSLVGFRRPRKA